VTYFNQRFRNLIDTPERRWDRIPSLLQWAARSRMDRSDGAGEYRDLVVLSLNYTFLHTRVEQSDRTDPNSVSFRASPSFAVRATLAPQLSATW